VHNLSLYTTGAFRNTVQFLFFSPGTVSISVPVLPLWFAISGLEADPLDEDFFALNETINYIKANTDQTQNIELSYA
jgi:hypothetical protein